MAAILFITLDCRATSFIFPPTPTPTATSTQTPTITPSPTPTLTPTVTPTSTPDILSSELQLSDLPYGFRPLSPPTSTDYPNMHWFAFGNSSPFQVIFGAVQPLKRNDQFGFDVFMKNPDLLLQSINEGAGKEAIQNLKQIPGLDQFGDSSNGYAGTTVSEGVTLEADIFLMRKGLIGIIVLTMYHKGQDPVMTIRDLAKILEKRESQPTIGTYSG